MNPIPHCLQLIGVLGLLVSTADRATAQTEARLPARISAITVWAGSSILVRTASNNEAVGGRMQMAGVQLSHRLSARGGLQVSWLVDIVPAMLATTGTPAHRFEELTADIDPIGERSRLARYLPHRSFGVGVAPLGLEVSRAVIAPIRLVFGTSIGGAIFSHVIPYGKATQANFIVNPSLSLHWRMTRTSALAVGYAVQHLSNGSLGAANPGLNSHLLTVRVVRERYR